MKATGLSLNYMQAEVFPLPTLGPRIRTFAIDLPDAQPYFLIRGLKAPWFSKHKNVAIFLGLSSHVATKRAMAAGDPNVVRKS